MIILGYDRLLGEMRGEIADREVLCLFTFCDSEHECLLLYLMQHNESHNSLTMFGVHINSALPDLALVTSVVLTLLLQES